MFGLVYGIILVAYLAFTGVWIQRGRRGLFYFRVLFVLTAKITEIITLIIYDGTKKTEINTFSFFVSTCVSLLLYNIQIMIATGGLFGSHNRLLPKFILFIPFSISNILSCVDPVSYSPYLVVFEGLIFLYTAKKSLELINKIIERISLNPSLQDQKFFHLIFVILVYMYFIEDLLKISLKSLIVRFYEGSLPRLLISLVFIDEIYKVIILSIFFFHLKYAEQFTLPNLITFYTSSITDSSEIYDPRIPILLSTGTSLFILTPFHH